MVYFIHERPSLKVRKHKLPWLIMTSTGVFRCTCIILMLTKDLIQALHIQCTMDVGIAHLVSSTYTVWCLTTNVHLFCALGWQYTLSMLRARCLHLTNFTVLVVAQTINIMPSRLALSLYMEHASKRISRQNDRHSSLQDYRNVTADDRGKNTRGRRWRGEFRKSG